MDVYEAIGSRRTVREFEDRIVSLELAEKIIGAGLMAPTNDHMRNWEFVIVNDKNIRADLLNITPLKSAKEINQQLDLWGLCDEHQRDMFHKALPRQYSMLYNAGCLILPFFQVEEDLLKPDSLSALNPFASIWCCIENMLLAAASEGIFGVTRIPMKEESEHIKHVVGHPGDYIMPCYMALGYPSSKAAQATQKKISVQDKMHINRWNKEYE